MRGWRSRRGCCAWADKPRGRWALKLVARCLLFVVAQALQQGGVIQRGIGRGQRTAVAQRRAVLAQRPLQPLGPPQRARRAGAAAQVVVEVAETAGIAAEVIEEGVQRPELKARLRNITDHAVQLGVTGVPTVSIAGEHFWGDDQLEVAAAVAIERG